MAAEFTRRRWLGAAAGVAAAVVAPVRGDAGERDVTVFAAASLKTALDEIAVAFEAATEFTATMSYAGSSALARQIQFGAPADVFLSASPEWMDALERDGLIAPETRVDLLGNRLVLIAHGGDAPPLDLTSTDALMARLGDGRLAMALVEAVPAGVYGRAALTNLGAWETLAPHVVQTDNVRAALALVAAGEAPLGVVYATDAEADPRVTVVGAFPETSHPPIVYPVAAVADRSEPATAPFLAFLRDAAARIIFERNGFAVIGPTVDG